MKQSTTYHDWQPGEAVEFYWQERRVGPVGKRETIPARWHWGIIQSITRPMYDRDDEGIIGPFRLATVVNPETGQRFFPALSRLRPYDPQPHTQAEIDETVAHMGREL